MSGAPPARAPRVAYSVATVQHADLLDSSSCAVALGLQHVLQAIMCNLYEPERLGSAALVCQQWSTVATNVTIQKGIHVSQDYDYDDPREELKESALVSWLNKMSPEVLQHLESSLKALRKLTFRHMNMVLDAPPRKTRPYYGDSDYDGSDASDDYDYYHAYHNHQDFDKYGPYTKAWQQVWVGCSQLAYLQVESCHLQAPALTGVGALQHLKELVLIDAPLTTASYLTPLPPNLTKLTFEKQWYNSASLELSAALSKQTHPGNHTGSSSSSTSGGSLLSLHAEGMRLDEPAAFSSLTSLTALHACGLRSRKPRDLLVVLSCLHKLRHLDLSMEKRSTSASPLQHNDNSRHPYLDTAAVEGLVNGCPDLEWLSVAASPPAAGDAMQEPVPFSLLALHDATRLTSLKLWANQALQDSNLVELARVTSLKFLDICASGRDITDKGVQELTQLTALTELNLDTKDAPMVSKEVAQFSEHHGGVFMIHRTPETVVGWTPDMPMSVWEQLAKRCALSSVLHPPEPGSNDGA